MPLGERRERQTALKAKVFRTTADVFCRRFMDALAAPSLTRAAA
jgi:trehalose 6-phosphate synthase